MSLTRPAVARSAAVALATGALALGLAVVPAVAGGTSITPHDPAAERIVPRAVAEVNGGATTFAVSQEIVHRLAAQGMGFAHVTADGEVERAASDVEAADANFTLGIRSGRMSSAYGEVTGRITYSQAGLALVDEQSDRTVRLSGFEADLTRGALQARMDEAARVDLGRFERPAADSGTVDTENRVLVTESEVRLTEESAEQLNEALDTEAFRAGEVLFDTRSTVTFDTDADLEAAFGARRG
ncbi:MAG TPA: hypothetical protein DEQ61_24690 [Streptomyces sp.]|nr:hypothetical protein [Streptomyces sp.]